MQAEAEAPRYARGLFENVPTLEATAIMGAHGKAFPVLAHAAVLLVGAFGACTCR